jgi:DNA-binding NarL/FixJ family response regulator
MNRAMTYGRQGRVPTRPPKIYLAPEFGEPFTKRQAEVAELVAQALSNVEIAEVIGTSIKNVESLVRCCYMKAGARSRVAFVLWWLKNGTPA